MESLVEHAERPAAKLQEQPLPASAAVFDHVVGDLRPPPTPQAVGHYRVVKPLASGGMGVVYVAEQEQPRRTVALKMIRPGALSDGLLKRFRIEAGLLGRPRSSRASPSGTPRASRS